MLDFCRDIVDATADLVCEAWARARSEAGMREQIRNCPSGLCQIFVFSTLMRPVVWRLKPAPAI